MEKNKKHILISHADQDGVKNNYVVKNINKIYTIGSSQFADFMVLDKDIEPIHAGIEYREDLGWAIVDFSSKNGVWVNGESFLEKSISNSDVIHIGQEKLSCNLVELDHYGIFEQNNNYNFKAESKKSFTQFAVFKNETLIESRVIDSQKSHKFKYGSQWVNITPAESEDWAESQVGDILVKKRRVLVPFHQEKQNLFADIFNKEMRGPFGVTSAIFAFLIFSLWVLPTFILKSNVAKFERNKYTQIILDENFIKKTKEKAQKISKDIKKTKPKVEPKKANLAAKKTVAQKKSSPQKGTQASTRKVGSIKPQAVKSYPGAGDKSRVVTAFKSGALSQLVGKVSKRAAANANIIRSRGVTADQKGSGRAVASVGKLLKSGGKAGGSGGGNTAGSFKVSGVGTQGVGGGGKLPGRLGGLSAKGIGTGAIVDTIEEETIVKGGLDPAVIAKIVKRNSGAIKYCYERQLAANPNLYGKVNLDFKIGASGSVIAQAIKGSTLNNSSVEGCILRRVKRWQFPKPEGGTEVAVVYPFYFKSNK